MSNRKPQRRSARRKFDSPADPDMPIIGAENIALAANFIRDDDGEPDVDRIYNGVRAGYYDGIINKQGTPKCYVQRFIYAAIAVGLPAHAGYAASVPRRLASAAGAAKFAGDPTQQGQKWFCGYRARKPASIRWGLQLASLTNRKRRAGRIPFA